MRRGVDCALSDINIERLQTLSLNIITCEPNLCECVERVAEGHWISRELIEQSQSYEANAAM